MTELVFLRHGPRADHGKNDGEALHSPYKKYDLLVTRETEQLAAGVAAQIVLQASFFGVTRKNVFVHFLPYLRCCETADLLVTELEKQIKEKHPEVTAKFQLLGDFALSEWIHDKMKNKPPFHDLTEAYQMYTPNIQMLQNKKYVSNFRPTTKLGPWNEPDLLFKEFQERCKEYFQKLLATYDKPSHDHDMIIVVSHGYVILNFILHFISQPIFEEIPEFSMNFAAKIDGSWVLRKDCLGMLERDPQLDATLNLDTDIVYYKTNFIKKDELDESREFPALGFGGLKSHDGHPRPSFRIKLLSANNAQTGRQASARNPLCPAAKDWDPQRPQPFQVKSEFRMKVMNDEAFKRAFDITKPPQRPTSPEVLPTSEPSRINLTVDLAKLRLNEEIYHPIKLKYSLAADVPVPYLNLKVNLHVSLHQLTSSSLELGRVPLNVLPGNVSGGLASPRDVTLDIELSPNMNEVISRLARVRSLQRRRPQTATPKFGVISEQDTPPADVTENKFALQFGHALHQDSATHDLQKAQPVPARPAVNTNPSALKFVPSMLLHESKPEKKPGKTIFYNFNSNSNSSDESLDEETAGEKYMWFGQNVRPGNS